jgi:hypothetical protein
MTRGNDLRAQMALISLRAEGAPSIGRGARQGLAPKGKGGASRKSTMLTRRLAGR